MNIEFGFMKIFKILFLFPNMAKKKKLLLLNIFLIKLSNSCIVVLLFKSKTQVKVSSTDSRIFLMITIILILKIIQFKLE